MITIIDYGLGNVLAFLNVYRRLNRQVAVARCAADLVNCTKLILPGVGSFDHAMERLTASGMRAPLEEMVLQRKIPILGVCVGMQMLAAASEEGRLPGLGWIDGAVLKFRGPAVALPHMGWNDVKPVRSGNLFSELEHDSRFYFLHSYYFQCSAATSVLAESEYNVEFSCAVHEHNIFGVQFHPEKSHHWGEKLLNNFAEL